MYTIRDKNAGEECIRANEKLVFFKMFAEVNLL